MKCRHVSWCLLGLLAGLCCAQEVGAQFRPFKSLFGSRNQQQGEKLQAATQLPLHRVHPAMRSRVKKVLQNPTLYAKGPGETFHCHANQYYWFLDNPERTMLAWRRLGAKCIEIKRLGKNTFSWSDDKGSKVVWSVVWRGKNLCAWYAQGKVKPSLLLPMIPVQCVVMLRHDIVAKNKSTVKMFHQTDVFMYTSSSAAALTTRLLGPSVPRMAKEAAAQLQMFFGAMAWYCRQHPDRARKLVAPPSTKDPQPSRSSSPFQIHSAVSGAAQKR